MVINGKSYTVDALDAIPIDIEDLATVITDHHEFFNERLSHFYKYRLEIDGTRSSCVAQFFQHTKAVLGTRIHLISAGEIMLATDPGETKRIGRRVTARK